MEDVAQTLTERSTIEIAEHVAVADLGGDAVLLDSRSGEYYGLNEVGASIFTLAQGSGTVEQILEKVYLEFEVDRERLRADALHFLLDLHARRLIEISRS